MIWRSPGAQAPRRRAHTEVRGALNEDNHGQAERVDAFWKEFLARTGRPEGEDDTLESWRAGRTRFFTREGAELGYEFSQDMPVVFEDFRVIYQV